MTLLVGENGSGKSNILEAIAFASCAEGDKLDSLYLTARGVRVTEFTWMLSAFPATESERQTERGIEFAITGGQGNQFFSFTVQPAYRDPAKIFIKWQVNARQIGQADAAKESAGPISNDPMDAVTAGYLKKIKIAGLAGDLGLTDFMIYAPESTTLRKLSTETAIQPLGTQGEGMITLLQSFCEIQSQDLIVDLQSRLRLFGWFDKFLPPAALADLNATLQIHDRWLAPEKALFDQRSANKGFLLVLFYFTLLMSSSTPVFLPLTILTPP